VLAPNPGGRHTFLATSATTPPHTELAVGLNVVRAATSTDPCNNPNALGRTQYLSTKDTVHTALPVVATRVTLRPDTTVALTHETSAVGLNTPTLTASPVDAVEMANPKTAGLTDSRIVTAGEPLQAAVATGRILTVNEPEPINDPIPFGLATCRSVTTDESVPDANADGRSTNRALTTTVPITDTLVLDRIRTVTTGEPAHDAIACGR
jgi:hypothetical protein